MLYGERVVFCIFFYIRNAYMRGDTFDVSLYTFLK